MSSIFDRALKSMDEKLGMDTAPEEGTPEVPTLPTSELPPAELEQVADPPQAEDQPEATPPENVEERVADEADDRPRDSETGQFITREQAAQIAETDSDVAAYLDKYQGDPEKAFRAAVEAQKRLGQQGTELGQTRAERDRLAEVLEGLQAKLEAPPTPAAPQPASLTITEQVVESFDEMLDRNPQAAVLWAAQNDPTGQLLNRGMEFWYEESPRAAAQFEMDQRMQAMKREFDERLSQATAPSVELASQNAIAQTWATLREELPGLDDRTDAILKAAEFAPEVADGLTSDDENTRSASLTKLYYLAGGMSGGALPEPQQDNSAEAAAAQLQQAARDAKLDGTAASQTTSSEPETVDEGEAWLRRLYDPVAARFQPDEFGSQR